MLHVARVLCLVPSAPAALRQAFHLARRLEATLHVMPHPGSEEGAADADDLRVWIDCLTPEGASGISIHRVKNPPESMSAVQQYVEDADIDLVVTDTPADRGPVPVLAADGSKLLAEQLECPLFITEHARNPGSIDDILVPTDFSDHAFDAFKHAVALARLYDATVHVLHVVESLPYVALTPTDRLSLGTMPLSEHRGRRRLRAFLRGGTAADVSVQSHLAYGDPADQIVHFADPSEVDLLVLSSHGNGNQLQEPLGRLAERVLGRVTCPLILCRAFGSSLLSPSTEAGPDDASA